jgi:hypothetical protein
MKSELLFFLFIFFSANIWAEPVKAVHGKIAVDGAAVYAAPNFDSEVIDNLNQGVKVPVSVKQFEGQGGMGLFHKIKTPRGRLGYIPDTDVVLPKNTHIETPKTAAPRLSKKEQKARERSVHVEKDRDHDRKSIYLTRYIGGTLASIDYTEKFQGNKLHGQTLFGGLRMTGPDILFKGPPFDFNVLISPGAPKYLGDIAHGSGNGFLLMTDLAMNMPLYDTEDGLLYYNLGLLLNLSDYKVSVGNNDYDSMDLRIGVDVGVGYAYRFSTYVVRADAKYYIEKSLFLGFLVSFQAEY